MSLWTVTEKLFTQAAPYFWSGNLPVVQEQQAQGFIQGKGHCRVLIPFSKKEPFLEMLTAKTCIQCFSMYQKEGDKFPVFFFPFLSEFWCQSTMLTPELGEEKGQGTGETRGGHSCTTGLSKGLYPVWSVHIAGTMLLLVSNMQLSLFCHLFDLIHSLLDCLRCTNTQHSSMKLS